MVASISEFTLLLTSISHPSNAVFKNFVELCLHAPYKPS